MQSLVLKLYLSFVLKAVFYLIFLHGKEYNIDIVISWKLRTFYKVELFIKIYKLSVWEKIFTYKYNLYLKFYGFVTFDILQLILFIVSISEILESRHVSQENFYGSFIDQVSNWLTEVTMYRSSKSCQCQENCWH